MSSEIGVWTQGAQDCIYSLQFVGVVLMVYAHYYIREANFLESFQMLHPYFLSLHYIIWL